MPKSTSGTRNVLFAMLGLAALAGGAAVVMNNDPQTSSPVTTPAAASYIIEETIELTAKKPWSDKAIGEGPVKLTILVNDPRATEIGMSCRTACKIFFESWETIEFKNGGATTIPLPPATSNEARQQVARVEAQTDLYFILQHPEDQ